MLKFVILIYNASKIFITEKILKQRRKDNLDKFWNKK